MKNLLIILIAVFSFSSCKKKSTSTASSTSNNTSAPTNTTTPTNTNTAVGDTTWFTIQLEAPATSAFNYKYDTLNMRILLNGQKIFYAKTNISVLSGQSINFIANFAQVGNQIDYPFKMKSNDTLTFIIDSLMYSSNNFTGDNPIRGGYIKVGKTKPTALTQYDNMMWSADNNAILGNPIGRHLGVANADGQGGSVQPFDWYVGKKYVYKYVKP